MRAVVIVWITSLVLVQVAAAQTIVIDPGHGGVDPGGVGTGMQEKAIVLDISQRFRTLLDDDTADTAGGGSWTTKLTRSDDTAVSLAGRSAYSNNQGADRFISIHANAFGDTNANGTETFSLVGTGTSAALRNLVQEEMIAAWNLTNRGNKTANFAVLRDTAAPAVLHELAFITNPIDAAKLASAEEHHKAAVAHLRALQRHYNLAPYLPGQPAVGGEIAGRVVDDRGPIEGAIVRLASGMEIVTPADGTFLFAAGVGTQQLTASAADHDERIVEVAVASGVRAETEIVLARVRAGSGMGSDTTEPAVVEGGCTTGRGSASWFLIGLIGLAFALGRRARR